MSQRGSLHYSRILPRPLLFYLLHIRRQSQALTHRHAPLRLRETEDLRLQPLGGGRCGLTLLRVENLPLRSSPAHDPLIFLDAIGQDS